MLIFLFIIWPSWSEFTPHNRGKKLPTARTFFWRGLHRKWNLFWNTQWEYYTMEAVNIGIFGNSGIFLDFFKIFFEKNYFVICSNTLGQHLPLLKNFWGIFWSRTVFIFIIALTQKKCAPLEVFSHKISPNCLIRQVQTTVHPRHHHHHQQ